MEERGAEIRSAFPFSTLSTVFYVFSAGACTWPMRTPEYRGDRQRHPRARADFKLISNSLSQENSNLYRNAFTARTLNWIRRNNAQHDFLLITNQETLEMQ